MTRLTVIEPEHGGLAVEISRQISLRGGTDGVVSVSSVSTTGGIPDRITDIIVVSPAYEKLPYITNRAVKCKILLIPGGFPVIPADAECVVTYGMNTKNTITLSSIGERDSILALQRELVTADGGVLDRQEIVVPSSGPADKLLAVSGAILLLGLSPGREPAVI